MKRTLFLMCAITLAMSGCTKGVYEEPYSDNPCPNLESQEFYASLEGSEDGETKTYLDENVKLLWHADDRISLFRSTLNEQFRFKGETGDNAGTFALVPSDEWGTGNEVSTNYGVYPYSENTKLTNEEEILLTMPSVQNYAPNSFGLGANTMVAATESASSTFLPFRNLCGFLMLKLYSENATIACVELTGNNNEVLAGSAVALAKFGYLPLLTMNEGGATSITLNCGEGVKLSTTKEEPTQFWLVVPPVTFEQGFTITITDIYGNVTTKSTSKKQTITRNSAKPMAAFEIENSENYVPSRTITYTTTDDALVEISKPSGLGSEIISHTYEDGVGVIRTKEPIVSLDSVFANKTTLYNVTLPNGLKNIGRYSFDGCVNLQNVTIPESVTTIGFSAFGRCQSFTSVTIPESVVSINSNPWGGCTNLVEFNAPNTSVDKRCLLSNDGKTLVSFASSGVTEYAIPEGITIIGRGSFSWNEVESLILPESITTIDMYGLYACPKITSLTLPANVSKIEGMGIALQNLETLVCEGSTPATAPNKSFVSSSTLKCIVVPEGCVDTYKAATGWSDYAEIIVDRMPQANNEIWYTATAKVEPYDKNVFGATYVSNEWDSTTGEGVITFDSDITSIGKNAFNSRRGLTSVTLPNSVTTIGQYAFEYCPNLTTMNIPESVTSINGNAFRDCANLSAFTGKFATADGCALIVNNAFCAYAPASTKYTSYTIPSGVTSIGESAFYGCKSLINITIPQEVTSIGMCAFYECNSLKSLVVPSGVKSIEKSTFYGCTSLVNVTIPDGVTSIGEWAFSDCNSLTSITIPDGVTTIGEEAFFCSGLTNIVIPEGVETIGNATFYNCSNLENATIPQSVTLIGRSAFKECSKLTSVYCKPTEVPSGADGMFYGNAEERKIYVPQESVDAYKGADEWKNYADAIIPYDFEKGEVVKVQPNNEIWYTATEKVGDIFYGFGANCVSNKWDSETGEGVITFDGDVIKIAYEAFHHCSGYHTLRSIAIPNSVASIEESAFSSCHTLTSVIIGNSVKSIGENAFYGCEKLGSIIIPNSVTAIEDYAFSECRSLTSVTIGNSVKSIGESAFSGCNSLPSIVIPGNVTSIGFQSFEHCSKLTSVILNNGVAKIDAYAFQYCHGLTSITIPESVTSIGYSAFYKCENLTSIYCKAITPPAAIVVYNSWDAFAFSALSRKFYVPTESVEAYKTAQYWKGYANDIVGYDF